MKKLGYGLITLSFLAGSLVAVLKTLDVQWGYFIPILVAGFVGVVLVQRAIRSHATAEHHIAANIESIHNSLESVVKKVSRLNSEKSSIDTYDMRHRIDELVLEDLDNFVEARESIGHKYGLQQYADVMSLFAAGERYLNRVWSASADGYIDEVHAYLEKAETQFAEAFEHLKALEAAHGT
jgi:RNase adaptor protein for sRNA GlmZ degradation